MDKSLSIVLSPEVKNYRKVAQSHWGLTDDQMKGKHVHHHPPVSDGGRNVPEHLYVCSPSMHSHGWHNGEYFIEQANIGAAKGARKGGLSVPLEARVRGGLTQGYRSLEEGTGLFAPGSVTKETCAEGGRIGGRKNVENKTGWYSLSPEQRLENSRKGGRKSGRKSVENKTGLHSLSPEQFLEGSRLGGMRVQELYPNLSKSIGEAHVKNKTGLFSPEYESVMLEWRRKGNRAASKKLSLPVICLETGKVYASCHEASRETGISNCNIGRAAQGKRKTAGKLHWAYVDSCNG